MPDPQGLLDHLDDDFISFLGKEIRPGRESIQTFR
jgi:hypothetical protein